MSLTGAISTILGGIGLFLLGMALMTDGLKAMAGARLRDHLANLTRRPRDAIFAGAAITALVQSSSATTLATIGFVSAGLMPFSTSVGVIVGANIGTTSTGWLVALLGLKFSIAKLAMPIVGIGALLRIIGRDRLAYGGAAAAGFGMIFIGIDFLQAGMQGMSALTQPSQFAGEGFGGRLLLVGIGIAMTVIMQSSSAAVATTLTALSSGALTLDQAAALVIGQNVGTTVTAVVGAIGATIAAQRTAAVHVLFNLITASVAVLILPLFTGLVGRAVARFAPDDPAITIAAFHTAFNLLGALLFLPLSGRVAALVHRLLHRPEPDLTRHLHHSVRDVPELATKVAREALLRCLTGLMWQLGSRLGGIPAAPPASLQEIREALPRINTFLATVPPHSSSVAARAHLVDLMRSVDHLGEVVELLDEDMDLAVIEHAGFQDLCREALAQLDQVRRELHENGRAAPFGLKRLKQAIAQARYRFAPAKTPDVLALTRLMQAQHWIEQIVYHLWRVLRHLEAAAEPERGPADETPAKAA